MADYTRHDFIAAMHQYADSIEQDMALIRRQLEDGTLTESETEGIMTRLTAEHELITEMITTFRSQS